MAPTSDSMPAGPPADAQGRTADDPTANVRHELSAAERRIDDLRTADKIMAAAERRHVREIMDLRHTCNEELRLKESERLDAIHAAAAAQVVRAAEVQATAQVTLATQASALAETLRTQVATTAAASSSALLTALAPIQDRLAELTKVQYQQAGEKAQTFDARTVSNTKTVSTGMWIGIALTAMGVLSAGFLGVAAIVVTLLLR